MSVIKEKTKRKPYDFYATPIDVIENFMKYIDLNKYGNKILDPGAGNGNISTVIKKMYRWKNVTALEIREEEREKLKTFCNNVIIDNFLEISNLEKYDIIIGNPPYSLAREFVEKSLELLSENGILVFLLRTSFLESKSRYEFWQKNPLSELYVLSKRPSFTGKGTDSASYAWFIWDKSNKENKQKIKVI